MYEFFSCVVEILWWVVLGLGVTLTSVFLFGLFLFILSGGTL